MSRGSPFRVEEDSMGKIEIPSSALWGAQTQRAIENFNISGVTIPLPIIYAIGRIKWAAAEANAELKLLDEHLSEPIVQAAREIVEGKWDDQFPVDVYQTGSATSTNMNVNEVIANRANQLKGYQLGTRHPVHPNDHVNKGQSSNDVIPSALHIAIAQMLVSKLLPSLQALISAFTVKSDEFADVIKIGRTHLQDAVPVTLGQEFRAYRTLLSQNWEMIDHLTQSLYQLPLGGTAVGTGLNAHPQFAPLVIHKLGEMYNLPFVKAANRFAEISAKNALVSLSSQLKTLAVNLYKIANDIRLMGSGPRCGFGELTIPAVQPGSSIMPGKVNPVIAESVMQIAVQVMGYDSAVTIAGASGNLELNVMMPIIGFNLIQSVNILASGCRNFGDKLIQGLKANEERCALLVEQSLALITALNPILGYDRAAHIAHEAYDSGKTIRQVLLDEGKLSEEEITRLLDPKHMV